ncbi:MAG: carbohydrate ABC transporter permease [Oscillospiraceae bacterium]|jgi:putative aldouronate transport system permease protein|nr:carbohydrate ABC transporter permease [Oscillospiraceae bacterium]
MVKDESLSAKVFTVVVHVTMIVVLIATLVPVIHVISISFSSSDAINRGLVSLWPVEFSLNAYNAIFETGRVVRAFGNSVYYTVLGTAINMLLTTMMAYPLSRTYLTFRKFYNVLILIPMFFGGGLIPTFLNIRDLGMYDTVWAIVLPGAISSWNLIIMRTFFMSLPIELEESAQLDGANEFTIFRKIILPLSMASLATITLFYAVGHWNSWFNAMIYFKNSSSYPLQTILRSIVIENQMSEEIQMDEIANPVSAEGIKYSTLVISMVPMMVVYPFVQKYFVKGVMIGSIKG